MNKIKITSKQIEEIANYLSETKNNENLEIVIEQFDDGIIKVENLPAETYIFNKDIIISRRS